MMQREKCSKAPWEDGGIIYYPTSRALRVIYNQDSNYTFPFKGVVKTQEGKQRHIYVQF